MNIKIENISRILIGLLFVFSGFVKSVDPMGGAIKFEEYFMAFSMDWFTQFSLIFSILLSVGEVVLGLALLLGVFKRVAGCVAQIFLLFFTLLTVYLYFADPVEDCGCFGDAVVMTNGETLMKNVISLIIFFPFFHSLKRLKRIKESSSSYTMLMIAVLVSLFMPLYAILYLPIIDFLPYKVGINIYEEMSIPEGAPEDIYETTLIYEEIASGKKVEFSVNDTTWYDQTKWKYIDTKTELITKGFTPKISSFNIFDGRYNDVTDQILLQEGKVAIIVINYDDKLDKYRDKIKNQIEENNKKGYSTIILSRFSQDIIVNALEVDIDDVYNGDETMLKSFIRASIGMVTLEKGTIISKERLM